MAEFDEKELSGGVLERLRKQALPLIEGELNRVAVATERMRVLASRVENFTTQKANLEKELADFKAKLADADACEDPGDINRQICAKETERAGLEERIESLSKGGDAFSLSRKELENAKTDLQVHIHQTIISIRAKYEEEFRAYP